MWSWEQRVAHYMRRRDGRDAGGGMVWGVAAGEPPGKACVGAYHNGGWLRGLPPPNGADGSPAILARPLRNPAPLKKL